MNVLATVFAGVCLSAAAAAVPPEEIPEVKELIQPGARIETIVAGSNGWVAIDYVKDIEKGSALDFSNWGILDAPAGKYGRVVARNGHFEFEKKPGVRQRFYGANLCSSSLFLSDAEIDQVLTRFERLGYNTFRIHHYDRVIVGSQEYARNAIYVKGIGTNALERLDKLVAEAGKRGFYLTIDLFTVREPKWTDCGIDRPGRIPRGVYKLLVGVHEGAYRDWAKFAKLAMTHRNPHNGLTWAEDPAIAFVDLINEGVKPVEARSSKEVRDEPLLREAWRRWLQEKRKQDPGYSPDAQPESYPASPRSEASVAFVSEIEARLAPRQVALLRSFGYTGPITSNNNSGRDFRQMQEVAAACYDYRDCHFYHDHCTAIGDLQPTSPPQRYPVTSPFGGRNLWMTQVAFERMPGMPFTVSEFCFPVPSPWRGAGTLMTGALAALQDWDALWHFAYSHVRPTLQTGQGVPGHYDLAKDVLNQMAERLNIAVFLRGDVKPHADGIALDFADADWRNHPAGQSWKAAPQASMEDWSWGDAAWKTRVATSFGPVPGWRSVPRAKSERPSGMVILEELRESPQVRLVRVPTDNMRWELTTERTCAGFSCRARDLVEVGPLSFRIGRHQAAVACTSLDGRPLSRSKRILLTHLTDAIGEGSRQVKSLPKSIGGKPVPTVLLLDWGKGRTLVQDGYADVDLALESPSACSVWALSTSGKRLDRVPTKVVGGKLRFRANVKGPDGKARLAYEIVKE